jgi:hypothetical protein
VTRAAGTSTSGTAGTVVASITAAAGKKYIGWTIYASQTSNAQTQFKITVTYSDSTTTTFTSNANSAATALCNAGGIEVIGAGIHVSQTALLAKDVTGLKVETAGTGSGTRAAVISAIEL